MSQPYEDIQRVIHILLNVIDAYVDAAKADIDEDQWRGALILLKNAEKVDCIVSDLQKL